VSKYGIIGLTTTVVIDDTLSHALTIANRWASQGYKSRGRPSKIHPKKPSGRGHMDSGQPVSPYNSLRQKTVTCIVKSHWSCRCFIPNAEQYSVPLLQRNSLCISYYEISPVTDHPTSSRKLQGQTSTSIYVIWRRRCGQMASSTKERRVISYTLEVTSHQLNV